MRTDSHRSVRRLSIAALLSIIAASQLNGQALSISPATLPPTAVGWQYQQQISASGGSPPYAWTTVSATLPTGLVLGMPLDTSFPVSLNGVPQQSGTFSFTLRLTDSASGSVQRTFSLVVNQELQIDGLGQLPSGTVGVPYSVQLLASGGVAPLIWDARGFTTALGTFQLSATGLLTGTPTMSGSISPVNATGICVEVRDSVVMTAPFNNAAQRCFALTVDPAPPVVTSVNPTTATSGAEALTLTVNGTGFLSGAQVEIFSGFYQPETTFVSSTQLTATLSAFELRHTGPLDVRVRMGMSLISNSVELALTAPTLLPSTVTAGAAAFTLAVEGRGFGSGTVVRWNDAPLATTFVSATRVTAAVPAALVASPGTASVAVNSGTTTGTPATLTIRPAPTTTSIAPTTALAGSSNFTLTVTGTNFLAGALNLVLWNGQPLATTFVSATQLSATVPASNLANPGIANITVTTGLPSEGGTITSPPLTFTITAPPAITSVDPPSATAGAPGFTLTVTGTGFASDTVVLWNGNPLATTFVSATQLTAPVAVAQISSPGSAAIAVRAGGFTSPSTAFAINARPVVTALSPTSVTAGSAAFTLTVDGSGFAPGAVVQWDTTQLVTTFVSPTQLTASVPADRIAAAGSSQIKVVVQGAGSDPPVLFTVVAGPTVTSLSPTSVAAGGAAFTLTITGTGFSSASVVRWNGESLATTLVSATQLTALVPAARIATPGTVSIAVSSTGVTSSPVPFAIAAGPAISSLSPISAVTGGPAFTLTVNGSGFVSGSVVLWNGESLVTTFVSSTQLTAAISAQQIATPGTANIAVSAGSFTSPSAYFSIVSGPSILSLSPASVTVGSSGFVLRVMGSGFTPDAIVQWNGEPLSTTFLGTTQVSVQVPPERLATAGTVNITVLLLGATTPPVPFTIAALPVITSISPTSVVAGGSGLTLTVTGTGFASAAVVMWNGNQLPTTFVSATQLTAAVAAEQVAVAGTADITVSSHGATTAAASFTIAPRPAITSVSPTSAATGGAAFTLTVKGVGFASGAVVQWNGQPLATTVVSATELTVAVPADRIAVSGTASITVTSANVTTAPPVSFTISQLVIISTPSVLPTATVGSPYLQPLQASGGSGTYRAWQLAGGGLPPGLTLDQASGAIAGTPTAAVPAAFTVQVSDSSGATGTKLFSLQVLPAAPTVTIGPQSIAFDLVAGAPIAERTVIVQVSGSGEVDVTASNPADIPWITVAPATTVVTGAVPGSLTVRANPAGVSPGTYFSRITILAGGVPTTIPVTVTVKSAPKPTLQLSQSALQFTAASGVSLVPAQQFGVVNSGQGLMTWSVAADAISGGPAWLSVSTPAGSTDAANPSAPLVDVRVQPAGLAPGSYYGQIKVTAPDASNAIQTLTVALTVLPPEQAAPPVVLPTGLIFLAENGQPAPAAQEIVLSNIARADLTFTTEVSSSDGQVWATVTPTTGIVTSGSSTRVSVRPVAGTNLPGIRRAVLALTFSDGTKRSIELLLVVISNASAAHVGSAVRAADEQCVANQVIPVFTSLSSLSGFPVAVRASQTVRVRAVEVGNNCANFVTGGNMALNVSDGSVTRGQHEREGVWAANWIPVTAGRITVTSTVTNSTGISGQASVSADAASDSTSVLPVTQSVTNAASYVLGQPIAPGSWVAIKGAELAAVDQAITEQVPFPTELSGTSVIIGDQPLPIYFVSRQQINAIVPFGIAVDTSLPLQVRRQGVPSAVQQVSIAQPQPGIFSAASTGAGQGSILIAGTTLLAAPPSGNSRPVKRGEYISIYGVGLGAVSNPPPPGAAAPQSPLSWVTTPASVEIGGVSANVIFAGLAPGFVGVYQINAEVPTSAPVGDRVPVMVVQGSSRTPSVTIAIE
jgi:uncharacterized protein (TIGR03437 family)